MRLFVGVEIDAGVAASAGELIRVLRRRVHRLAPRARIAWIPEERMHLTVRFIGHADEAHAAAIRRVLDAPITVPPFPIELAGIGAFPATGKPKVLWAALAAGREPLAQVAHEVTRRLSPTGVPPEQRPYSPHLTLGRVKDPAGLESSRLFEGLDETGLGTTHVEAITLFESRLSPNGPTYVPLLHTRLVPPH